MQDLRHCTICKEDKTPDCFYLHSPYKGKRTARFQCIDCVRQRNLNQYYIRRYGAKQTETVGL